MAGSKALVYDKKGEGAHDSVFCTMPTAEQEIIFVPLHYGEVTPINWALYLDSSS